MNGIQEKKKSEYAQSVNLPTGISKEQMKEIFRPINGYDFDYYISNMGRVKTMKKNFTGIILNNQNNTYGYHHVLLCKDGKRKTKLIHQLVIDAFYPIQRKYSNLLVDHIDNNRKNNCILNLRLVDYRENVLNRIDVVGFKSKFHGVTLTKIIKTLGWPEKQ